MFLSLQYVPILCLRIIWDVFGADVLRQRANFGSNLLQFFNYSQLVALVSLGHGCAVVKVADAYLSGRGSGRKCFLGGARSHTVE